MPVVMRCPLVLALLLLVCAQAARADSLSKLPAALIDRLQLVAAVSLDTLDSDTREQLAQARRHVSDAVDRQLPDAEIAEAYGELGALYQVHSVYTAAMACYSNARTLAPDNFRWAYYHAYLTAVTGETEQAVVRFEQARRLRPDYPPVTLRLADAWLELNELDKAQAAYRQVAEIAGLEAAALYGLGQIAVLRRDFAGAIDYFERALALQPEATRIHYTLAQALRAAGQSEAAKAQQQQMGDRLPIIEDPQIESLQSLKQGSRVDFSLGMKAIKKRDYVSTRDAFARGLEREPDNVEARISYARALYLTGDKSRAKQQLEDVLSRAPSNVLAQYLLGILTEEEGDTADATGLYQRVIAQEPSHAGANFYLANRYYRDGVLDKAVQHYATTIASDSGNLAAYLPYTGALLQAGHKKAEILALAEAALKRFPEQPVLRYLLIQLQACPETVQACDSTAALEQAGELVERQPIPPHRELLALARAAKGDFDEAVSLQQALVSDAILMMPTEIKRLRACLSAYQDGKLPQPRELFTWQLLQAPPMRGVDVFRDYPTPKPY